MTMHRAVTTGLSAAAIALAAAACSKSERPTAAAHEDAAVSPPLPPATAPVNALPIPSANVMAMVNPEKLPPYDGPTGSVEGTIRISGDPPPDVPNLDVRGCPDAVKTYGKLFREGAPDANGERPLADAIVAVTGYSGYYVPERNEARSITIRDCAFPRVVDMTFGQRLEIKNETTQMWAPELEQAPMPALMLAAPHTDPVKIYPPRPGHFMLIDKIEQHPYARSDLWVLLHPLHAVSALDGHYRIDGVPVGKLKVNTRLTYIGQETSKEVEILAGVVQKVDLALHYTAPKDAGAPPHAADAGPRILKLP